MSSTSCAPRRRRPRGPLSPECLIAVLAAWSLATAAVAAPSEPWDGPAFAADPAAVAAAAAALPRPEKAEVEILLESEVQALDADGLVSSTRHRVYRLLDAAALENWWSAIEIQWAPWYQERPEVRARVIAPDGSVRLLDAATLAEAAVPGSDPRMFEDTRRLRAPLPGLAIGAVVEIEVVQRRLRPYFAAGESRRLLLSEYAPVRRSRLVLDLPAGLDLHLRAHQLGEPKRTAEDGRERVVYEAADLVSLADREPWLPPDAPQLGPYVDWATGRSWAAVAAAYDGIVEPLVAGADLGDLLDGLGEPGEDRDAWLARLLTRLHRRVRYTGVELDEARIVPRSPAETLARGFGDCKDKAVLLVAALRRAGVPAHVALLKAGYYRSQVDPGMPGLGEFDHAIVHLPGEPATWIDATDPFSRPGELASGDRGRRALVIAPGTEGLTTIPEASAADNRIQVVRDVYLAETGEGRVVEETELHGASAASRRSGYHGQSRDAIEEWFEERIDEVYLSGELTSFEISEPDDLSSPMRERLEVSKAGLVITDSEQAVVGLRLAGLFHHLPTIFFETPEEPREHPFALDDPYRADWTYHIHLPPGLAVRHLPEDAEDAVGPAWFQRSYELSGDGRRVDVRASFELDRGRLAPEEFAAVVADIERLNEKQASYVLIWFDHTVNAHLAAGRLSEAIAEAQRLTALHPDEALHAGQLANALLAGSLGAEARLAARRATELEPEEAAPWATLGRMLLHDDVGRRFEPGYDREGAIAALRKAAELDPEDHSIRGDLAIALEHDAEGRRWSEGVDVEAAVAVYRELSDHLEEIGIGTHLAIALLRAGRYEEMREASERLTDEAQRNQFVLVAVALSDGPGAAVREAERRYPQAEARATALANAAQDLLLLRRYPESAELSRIAARQSPRAASLLSFAEIVARAVPYEELIGDESDAKAVFVRFLALLMEPGGSDTGDELHGLFARTVRENGKPEEVHQAKRILGPQLRRALGETPPEVAVDLAAAAISASAQGDDEVGYRVRFQGALGGQVLDTVFLMVREERALRVVATLTEDPSPIGLEALRRVDAGDLAGARQWLDWALDRGWSAGQVGDPFSADGFPHFWSGSGEAREDPGAIRLAAAVLAATLGRESVIEVLEAARGSETGLRQARIDQALLIAHAAAEGGDGASAAVGRLRERIVGESDSLFLQSAFALGELDRRAELESLAADRQAAQPDDPWSLRVLAMVATEDGDLAAAMAHYERLFAAGDESANDLNNAAWMALAGPAPPSARHLELARRSIALDADDGAALHTLAALLAVSGQVAEARRVLLQSIEAEGDPVDGHDLYVLGLLAEAYGLPEAAARYYQRALDELPEEKIERPTSTAALARARGAALRAAASPAGR